MKIRLILLYALSLILSKCASVQPPPGGPRDETEPELISTIPVNGSKNYKGNTIQFLFNEDVQLDNIYKQLLITPITEELKYESRVKRNRVILSFENDFIDSTTYTINLRDAVVDVTEKNIAKNVKIAFSTGNFIDSMSVSGNVADLYSGLPPEEAVVMLFRPEDTINIQDPYYLSKTDEEGNYSIENIKVADYQIFALEESDNNYKYTKDEEEKIGFVTDIITLDSVVENFDFKVAEYDNIDLEFKRSTSRNQYVELNFSKPLKDIYLTFEDSTYKDSTFYAIEEDIIRLYSTRVPVEEKEKKTEELSKKEKKKRRKNKKNSNDNSNQELQEEIVTPDSIVAFIRAVDFLEEEIIDTTKFIFQRKRVVDPEDLTVVVSPKSNEKKIVDEIFDISITFNKPITNFQEEGMHLLRKRDTTLFKIDSLFSVVQEDTISINADSTLFSKNDITEKIEWQDTLKLVINDSYIFDFQKLNSDIQNLLLVDKNSSTLKKATKITSKEETKYSFSISYFDTNQIELDTIYYDEEITDTLSLKNVIERNHLSTKYSIKDFKFNPKESIYIDSTAFISVEDDSIANTVIQYEAKIGEDYGILAGNISLADSISYFVQVLDDKFNMEQEKYNINDFKFEYVEPGSKYIRIFIDNNNNGIWEKGSFKLRIPPEEVRFRRDGPLDLRPNWEILDIFLEKDNLSTYQQNKEEN